MHSVESPSMVDPQWIIWYWGSKWILHTVCWSAVGCEWGTTSVYFGITHVCFIPRRLPVFAVEPQYLLQYFLFLSKVSFELHIQNLQKISCWFKIWMGFVGPILIKLWTSSIWGFSLVAPVKVSRELLMQTCWWPLSDYWSVQTTSPHLSGFVFYGCLESLTELSALWGLTTRKFIPHTNDHLYLGESTIELPLKRPLLLGMFEGPGLIMVNSNYWPQSDPREKQVRGHARAMI